MATTGMASPARKPIRPRTEHSKIPYANRAINPTRPTPRAKTRAPRSRLCACTIRSAMALTEAASQRKLIHPSAVPSSTPAATCQPSGHSTAAALATPAMTIMRSMRSSVWPHSAVSRAASAGLSSRCSGAANSGFSASSASSEGAPLNVLFVEWGCSGFSPSRKLLRSFSSCIGAVPASVVRLPFVALGALFDLGVLAALQRTPDHRVKAGHRAEDDAGEINPVRVQKVIGDKPENVPHDHRRRDHEADFGVARHRHPRALLFVRFLVSQVQPRNTGCPILTRSWLGWGS